jgi:hypothetical protein
VRHQVCVGNWLIETTFAGQSRALDGPRLFWLVRFSGSTDPRAKIRNDGDGFPAALSSSLATRCETLEEAFKETPPFRFEKCFGTREEALEFHASLVKQARAKERLRQKMPEKFQEFLVELGYWCEQEWGRQAKLARAVGTSAQTVNDWLNGRKSMTGEQVLRVQDFLHEERNRYGARKAR